MKRRSFFGLVGGTVLAMAAIPLGLSAAKVNGDPADFLDHPGVVELRKIVKETSGMPVRLTEFRHRAGIGDGKTYVRAEFGDYNSPGGRHGAPWFRDTALNDPDRIRDWVRKCKPSGNWAYEGDDA